jgi:hypothetical protein
LIDLDSVIAHGHCTDCREKRRHIDASRVVQPTDAAAGARNYGSDKSSSKEKEGENEMRRMIAILVLGVSLAGCGGASETDHIATPTSQCTTASEFKTSGTGRLHRAYHAPVGECQRVIVLTTSLRDQFMAMGMNEDQAQKLAEKYKNTHDAAGRFFLVADGADQ